MTLKEGLVELGFKKSNTLVADTGVFEIEARKSGIARRLGITPDIELSIEQIFEAYEISGADYFVSPDEIILPTDDIITTRVKVEKIKSNMLSFLKQFPAKKAIGVIQGNSRSVISEIYDFYRSHNLKIFAAGGIIPLYKYDKELFKRTLRYIRQITNGFWLHTFGLPMIKLLPFYLGIVGMDSVDTSMLLYLTARRRYLQGIRALQVRIAKFDECSCRGCRLLKTKLHPRSIDFFTALYIHNLTEATKISKNPMAFISSSSDRKDSKGAKEHKPTEPFESHDSGKIYKDPNGRTASDIFVETKGG
ncbi:hypothetical protein EU537_02940 [Candidatus Thorarchaeota archaeon]|nr:MAG: hypothetical protein EU537_02940 [Candidatus Thorarchaeota archaeon]